MQEVQVSMGIIVAVGCLAIVVVGICSAAFFAKRNDNNAENAGTILSIITVLPFFCSLVYLLTCIIKKVGESI